MACINKNVPLRLQDGMKSELPKSLPHGNITSVLDDIFVVRGMNVVDHDGVRLQASRTMTIIRQNKELTLINTIRLDEDGLRNLSSLGQVKNIIRLGAFHGRDDAFYQRAFGAKLWAFKEMDFSHGEVVDYELGKDDLPIKDALLFAFKSTRHKEALLLLKRYGGILISCDSIKNWQNKDEFFDDATYKIFTNAGSIGQAKIDKTWLKAMTPTKAELKSIVDLDFTKLISAHGSPVFSDAKKLVASSVEKALVILDEK
jgi:hypothetical protein